MARRAAMILTRIWRDDDFLEQDPFDKLVLLEVVTQDDVNHAGVVPHRPAKWAKRLSSPRVQVTAAQVTAALGRLEAARFVVIDEEEGELLIRTYLRNDDVYKQVPLIKAAFKTMETVASARVREATAVEVARLLGEFSAEVPKTTRPVLEAMLSSLTEGSSRPEPGPDVASEEPGGSLPAGFAQPEAGPSAGRAQAERGPDAARAQAEAQPLGVRGEGTEVEDRSSTGSYFSSPEHDDAPEGDPDEAATASGADEETGNSEQAEETEAKRPKVPKADLVPRGDVDELCAALVAHRVRLGCKPPTVTQDWRTEARRLLDLDRRPLAEAMAVLDWCQQDGFWSTNIESMPTFRRQYDKLRMRRDQATGGNVVALRGPAAMSAKHEMLARSMARAEEQDALETAAAGGGS